VIKPFIEAGLLRAYSVNSVNKYSLLNKEAAPQWKAELLTRYDRYVMEEVLPLIRNECGQDAKPLTTGASLGAFLAANCYFKHSDNFRGTIAMSGSYNIYNYLENYFDDNVYFNNPMMYLKNLNDDFHLRNLQKADSIVIATGQGAFEAPDRSRELSGVLHSKGIPHLLEIWGYDVNHDWEWWRKMLPFYLEKFFN
jgi:esterase/lipase superfamily enzyme